MDTADKYREWMIERYNAIVLSKTEGTTLTEVREEVAQDFLDALTLGSLPTIAPDLDYARSMFRSTVEPERDKRRTSFRKQAEYLLDAMRNPEDGIHVEPFLDVAYPLGTHDGRDKAMRHWTEMDLIESSMERYRNAAAAMQAAKEHDVIAQELIAAMRGRSAAMLGDCFVAADY